MNRDENNATELTETEKTKNGEVNGKGDTPKENPPEKETVKGRIGSFLNSLNIEPYLLCFIVPSALSALAVQKLNMEKACRADLNYTAEICTKALEGDTSDNITQEAQNAAVKLVADMYSWQYPMQSAIPAIVVLFVGAWSDKTGNRKVLMMIPMLGELISAFGLFWATYFFMEWPLWVTGLIESLPSALCGGYSICLLGAFSFIADVSTIESRTFRLGIVTVIVSLGLPFGTSISGVLTKAVGYYGIFSISTTCYAFGLIYTYFRVHNVRTTKIEGSLSQKLKDFFHPRNVWDTFSFLVSARGRKLAQIILIIVAHVVIMGPVVAEGSVTYLYTLQKFGMDEVEFSLFSTYYVLMSTAGTAVAVGVFSKALNMHDAFIGIIATTCKTVSSFVFGLAPTKHWFYSGPVFDFFGNSGVTIIRSLGTKVVKPDEVGRMCSLFGLVEALLPIIYTPAYTKLYTHTLNTFPGAFYVLGGVMTIPAVFNFIALYVMQKKQQRDTVQNPDKKEAHAYDNDVTAL